MITRPLRPFLTPTRKDFNKKGQVISRNFSERHQKFIVYHSVRLMNYDILYSDSWCYQQLRRRVVQDLNLFFLPNCDI